MPREAALKLAQEKELDLIEIAPLAKPPVARIINFDKFRYQQEKELRKQRASQKISELKQVRIGAKTGHHDLKIKVEKIKELLSVGHRVEIMLVLKGREKYNRIWARQKLDEFLKMIEEEYKITMEPRFGGRGMIMQISKK